MNNNSDDFDVACSLQKNTLPPSSSPTLLLARSKRCSRRSSATRACLPNPRREANESKWNIFGTTESPNALRENFFRTPPATNWPMAFNFFFSDPVTCRTFQRLLQTQRWFGPFGVEFGSFLWNKNGRRSFGSGRGLS